ncbi:unnamed protein product [Calypogeia fissa]
MASSSALSTGPAARTVVLLMPQLAGASAALVPPSATGGAVLSGSSSSLSLVSSASFSAGANGAGHGAGPMVGNSTPMPRILDPKCLEALLGYARLLFAQPHGGKLAVLGGAGNKMHTITSWDPGQQTLESIMKGFSQWKLSEQEFTAKDLQFAIQESVQFLFQAPVDGMENEKSELKSNGVGDLHETVSVPAKSISELWKTAQMARARLLVVMAPNWGAGDSMEINHKMVLTALTKTNTRSSWVECFDVLLMDVSSRDLNSNTCVCMQDSATGMLLSTAFYKLPPACSADLLLDLAYLHFELSAVAVKGLATPLAKQQVDETSGGGSLLIKHENIEGSLELNLPSDTDLRLVLYESSTCALTGGCCFTPNGGELRKSRTFFLYRVNRRMPKPQLLALPYTSVALALLEVPHSRSAAHFWETMRLEDADSEGSSVLALSSERDSMSVTHLLVWRLDRFWLRVLKLRDASEATKGESYFNFEEPVDNKGATRSQGAPLFSPDSLIATIAGKMTDDTIDRCGQGTPLFSRDGLVASMPGKLSDEKPFINKKRGCEDVEDSGNPCCGPNHATRERKGSKQLDRPNRCIPPNSETLTGGPDKHSAGLAALLAPIRSVFMSEDPAAELVNTATSYVARLLEFTEKNDGSLFPSAGDVPVARRELYKKMWWELKRLAKRTRKDKTQGQEDLAQAIRAAKAEFKTSERQLQQPLPALTDKPTEHVHINKRRRCEEVPRDIHGRPIFPIKLGPSLQVYDLGNVVYNRPAFHSEKYIWPAGYKSRRAYASMLNSENRIFYWCEIVDDGQAPEFRLTPEDDENNPVVGISATAVWTVVVKRVGALRLEEGGKKTFANVSGPEYFGFANPTIARLIQQLPNSEKCSKYKRQDYFPNVPMRSTELDAWQGVVASEGASSPQMKENVTEGQEDIQVPQPPQEHSSDHQMTDVGDTADQDGATAVSEDDVLRVHSSSGNDDSELRGMSWDSEEFRKAFSKRHKLGLAEFSKQFLASNSGSLFSYYWSAKLKRAAETIELDGRR